MKKVLMVLLAAMLFLMCACGNNADITDKSSDGSGNSESSESTAASSTENTVKGSVHEFGRFSVFVPEGWEPADLGDYQADYNGIIVKGKGEDFMTASSVSILYFLPIEMVVSGRGFYDNVRDQGEFDLGTRHWEAWSAETEDMTVVTAESYGDDGTITVTLNMPSESKDILTLEDPDVQEILKSITVVPTVEVEWITLKDGTAVAALPEVEGYQWAENGRMYSNELVISAELNENQLTITPQSGSGACSLELSLENEDGSLRMGEAKVGIRVTDAKADAVYTGEVTIYDEPEENGYQEPEDNTDYEFLMELYSGTWVDNNNDLTLFIQEADDVEHGCLINIQLKDKQITATGVLQEDGSLIYEEISVNGVPTESAGYFMPDGDMLIWGHDEAAGEFEYGTLFVKLD